MKKAGGDNPEKMRILRPKAFSERKLEPIESTGDRVEDLIYKIIVGQRSKKKQAHFERLLDKKEYRQRPRRNSKDLSKAEQRQKPVDYLFVQQLTKPRLTGSSRQSKTTSLKTVWTTMANKINGSDDNYEEMAGKLTMTDRFNIVLKHRHNLFRQMRAFKKKIMRELGMAMALTSGDMQDFQKFKRRRQILQPTDDQDMEQSSSSSGSDESSEFSINRSNQIETELGQADSVSAVVRIRRTEGFFLERNCCKMRKVCDHTKIQDIKPKKKKSSFKRQFTQRPDRQVKALKIKETQE